MAHKSGEPDAETPRPGDCGLSRSGRWARVLLILFLAAASVATEALLIYYNVFFSNPVHNTVHAADVTWTNGDLVVTKIVHPAVLNGGLREGDRIFSVILPGGREVYYRGDRDASEVTRALRYGRPFDIRVVRRDADGKERTVLVRYPSFPASSRISPYTLLANMAPSILLFLACLAAALLIGLSRPEDEGAFAASLMFFCFGALNWHGNFGLYPQPFRALSYYLWALLFALITATLMWFCLRFPSPSPIDRRLPWLKRAGVEFALAFAAWNIVLGIVQDVDHSMYDQYLDAVRYTDWVLDLVFCLLTPIGIASLILNRREAVSPDERRRLTILLCGMLGLLPWLLAYLNTVTVGIPIPLGVLIFIGFAQLFFPVSFIYAVVRHRVFGIRVILRRGLQFALLSKGFLVAEGAVIFAALYFAVGPHVARAAGGGHPGALAVGIAGVTVAFVATIGMANPKLMGPIERRFFREAYDARSVLTTLTFSVRRLVGDFNALGETSVRSVSVTLHPSRTALFLRAELLRDLPSKGEGAAAARLAGSKAPPAAFLCFWQIQGAATGSGGEKALVPLPIRLEGDAALVGLMARTGAPPGLLSLDPKDRRSAALALTERAEPGELAVLEGTLGTRLVVPLSVGEELLGFLCLGEKLSEEPYSREDTALLLALAQQMADTLDHARLLHRSEEEAQLHREVEIAQQVQRNLLPAEPPIVPGLDLAGVCRPARYVGGDYYDFIRTGDTGVALVLGDISGKGISAALLMAALQATLREKADALGREPSALIAGVNRRLCASAGEGRFATLFYGVLDSQTRELDYSNAGHNPPLLWRPGDGGIVLRLEPTGTVVGIFTETAYGHRTLGLKPGDLLILYSDGITEAMNEAAEFFEEDRLVKLLPSLAGLTAADARDRILAEVEAFIGPAPQADDITLIIARVL